MMVISRSSYLMKILKQRALGAVGTATRVRVRVVVVVVFPQCVGNGQEGVVGSLLFKRPFPNGVGSSGVETPLYC